MIKKLFCSTLLLAFAASSALGQTTYFLKSNLPSTTDMNDVNNWEDAGLANPPNFSNPLDTFDLNGVNGDIQTPGPLTIAGSLKNSSTSSTIYLLGEDLILQGVVQGTNLSIVDNAVLPILSTSVVEYAYSGSPKDIISGTYSNMLISGTGNFLATGDITINKNLSTSGSTTTRLVLGGHQLIDTSSFSVGSIGSGPFTIETSSGSTSPIPENVKWPDGTRVVYSSASTQYVASGSYDSLYFSGTGQKIISAGDTVVVRNGFDSYSELILAASSSDYGQLKSNVDYDDRSGSGSITKQHYLDITTAKYFHRGTALDGADLQDFNDGQTMTFANDNTGSVWEWDASTSEWAQPSPTGNAATSAYAIFAGNAAGNDYLLSATGTVDVSSANLHYQDISATLDYDNASGSSATFADLVIDGWNFIANPFLANYDFEGHDTAGSIAGGMSNYYYVLNGSNFSFYQKGGLTNGTGGTAPTGSSAAQYIAPGQGVWVRTTSDWDGTTSFDIANIKMSGSSQMYQTTLPVDIIKLNVAEVGGSYSDQVIIRLNANATDAEDFSLDVPKKSNPGNVPNTYVQLGNGTYALCAANPSRKSFPLHFRDIDHGQQMEYSIWENTLVTYGRVFIEDKKNNSFTELTASNYTFTNDTAYGEDRFVIHFESGVGLPEGMIPGATAYDAFYSNGTIQITFQEESFKPSSGNLYTLQGKLVSSFEISDTNTSIAIPNVSTGIYLLAIDGDTAGARKLYINK